MAALSRLALLPLSVGDSLGFLSVFYIKNDPYHSVINSIRVLAEEYRVNARQPLASLNYYRPVITFLFLPFTRGLLAS